MYRFLDDSSLTGLIAWPPVHSGLSPDTPWQDYSLMRLLQDGPDQFLEYYLDKGTEGLQKIVENLLKRGTKDEQYLVWGTTRKSLNLLNRRIY